MFIGRRLNDRYDIKKIVGGGGMSNVYLAHDIILEREVAVKMLRIDFSNNEEFVKRFQREASSISALSHPNIVNIYDVGEEEGMNYIVMEYMPGPTLKEYIQQKGALSVTEAIPIMEQLVSALSHAHHFDIIHRDIKPQNILMDENGEVKLTDFGVATMTSATTITQTNSVLGSVHYLSPEQARGRVASKKSDIYSLGIVFFELLTGRPPFSGESPVSIAIKHLQSETPSVRRWNESIPQSVENIILKAMAKDPEHRYASADLMKEDIQTAMFPERIDEQKFIEPEDLDATKVLPIITKEPAKNIDETIIHKVDNKASAVIKKEPVKEEKKKNTNKKAKQTSEKWKKHWKKFLITFFVLIVAGGILAVTVFPAVFFPNDVVVPDVKTMGYEEAVQKLKSEGFTIGESKEIYDDEIEEGKVVRTSPAANANVKEGSTITIFQSRGTKESEMDSYVGERYADIKDDLKSKFKNVVVEYKESDKEAGEILSQTPEQGEIVISSETELTIWVSKKIETVKVKDVVGTSFDDVKDYADKNNLVISYSEEYSDTVAKGNVISQSPKANTEMKKGDKLSIVVSLGKKENPPRTVSLTVQVPFTNADSGEAQKVEVYIDDLGHTMDEPADTRTITNTINLTIKLNIPYGGSASYRIVRDGTTLTEKTIPYPSS